jgi:hypothetical protein
MRSVAGGTAARREWQIYPGPCLSAGDCHVAVAIHIGNLMTARITKRSPGMYSSYITQAFTSIHSGWSMLMRQYCVIAGSGFE